MNRVLSTQLLLQHRLTSVWLDRIFDAGIPAVEIFCGRQHFDYRNRAQMEELGHWFADSDLTLHSLHSPMFSDEGGGRSGPSGIVSITETNKAKRQTAVDEIKRALEFAEIVPFRYLVQHFGVPEEEYDERKIDAAFTALEEIRLFARARDVNVLLENIPNAFSTGERLMQFLRMTHLDVYLCLDVGHAHLMEGVEAAFEQMAERIRSTHLHDNDGTRDQHLFPFSGRGGTVDWLRTMELLRSRPDQYPLLLEVKEVPDLGQPLQSAAQVFDKLESLRREDR